VINVPFEYRHMQNGMQSHDFAKYTLPYLLLGDLVHGVFFYQASLWPEYFGAGPILVVKNNDKDFL
jgi:hypothetical protein